MLAPVLPAGSSVRTLNTPSAVWTLYPAHHRATKARERGVEEVDRDGVVENPARPRWRHGPAVGTAVLVQPIGYLGIALAKAAGWNTDPDADGEASLGNRDQVAPVTRHFMSLFRS